MIRNNGGRICGIYAIRNIETNQIYIGQSNDINRRMQGHIGSPDKYSYIDNAIKKHGRDKFKLIVLARLPENQKLLDSFERFYIRKFNSYENSNHYNLTDGGNGSIGENNPRYRHDLPKAEELYEEWLGGSTYKQLAAKYNCGESTISRRVRKLNNKNQLRNKVNITNELLYNEWKSGLTQKQVAEKYNCSVSTVESRISKYKAGIK